MIIPSISTIIAFLIKWFIPLTYAFIGFCLLIVVHELGHFLFAKLFGIHTPTFSIGMGPKIFEKKIGKTNFCLSLLPLGGYVEIAGNAEVGQGDQSQAHSMAEDSFATKPYWQKLLVMFGGILFNLGFAYITMSAILFFGLPKSEVFICSLEKNTPCSQADLLPKDRILSWNDTDLESDPNLLSQEIHNVKQGKTSSVTLTILRNSSRHTTQIDVPKADQSDTTQPKLGIEFEMLPSQTEVEKLSLWQAIREGTQRTNELIVKTVNGILGLFKKGSLKDGAGPIMIIAHSAKLASQSFAYLLWFLVFISINLAIINLIPVPVMDGGQIMFITIEALIRRPLPDRIKNSISMASAVMLLILFVIFSYNDVKRLVFSRQSPTQTTQDK